MKNLNGRALLVHVIGFIIARAVMFGINPLAVGYFTAAYLSGSGKVLSFAAIFIAVFSVMDFADIIKYSLTLIASVVIMESPVIKKKMVQGRTLYSIPSVALFAFSIIDGISSRAGRTVSEILVLSILEMITALVSAVVFKYGIEYIMQIPKSVKMNNEQMISIALMVAASVYALPNLRNAYVSWLYSAVYFIILYFTYKFGIGQGAITGSVCGLIMSLKGGPVENIGAFAIMGILPAIFRVIGRVPTAIIYVVTALMLGLFNPDMALSIEDFGALITASIIFLLLPGHVILRVDAETDSFRHNILAVENLKKTAETRMRNFSDSFLKLSKSLEKLSQNQAKQKQKELDLIFEEISEKLCKSCANCSLCWENNFMQTYRAACSMFETAEKKGSIDKEDVPEEFLSDCICADEFIRETNRGFELARLNKIWRSKLEESRGLIALQLKELSGVISDITGQIYETAQGSFSDEERIIKRLRAEHIRVKDLSILEMANKRKEIHLAAACKDGRCITAKEAASAISEAIGRGVKVSEASKTVITQNYENFIFVEDTKFKVLTGVARAKKDNVSGDNFSILKMETGECMLALSDGMGFGDSASEESETVMSLLEQMIEAGFKAESAIKLINSSLVLMADKQSFTTVDMALINLFTGMCDFIKIGAAAAFIKRGEWVETISSSTLPIGMLGSVDYETVSKKLYEGDIIIMVTDGVLDCIDEINKEEIMEKIILDIKSSNPQEIANQILERMLAMSNYIPKDDMTVLCAGMWLK